MGKASPSTTIFKLVIAAVTTTAAILTGLRTFLNLSEKAEKHRSAGVRYKGVIRELERILSEGPNALAQAEPSLPDRIQRRLDELEESAPIVPEGIYNRVEDAWKARGMTFIGNAADLYKPKGVTDTLPKMESNKPR